MLWQGVGQCGTIGTTALRTIGTTALRTIGTTAPNFDRYFTKKHEWVLVTDNIGTVGVSSYAAETLGDIVYAQLPEPGDSIEVGGEVGALESVKAAAEIYSPVSGTVTEKNEKVEFGPALINQSVEDEGWLYRLEMSGKDELEKLMNEEEYKLYLESQADE